MSIDKIAKDPLVAQSSSMPDIPAMWTPISNKMKQNTITVSAYRNFNKNGSERDLKLGQTRKWAIGFLDMSLPGKMPFQFSDTMEMVLDNDAPKKQRDMAEKNNAMDANRKNKNPMNKIMDFMIEEMFGKATSDVFSKTMDREKKNAQRKKKGLKPINYQDPETMKKDSKKFFDLLYDDLFKKKDTKYWPDGSKERKANDKRRAEKKAQNKTFFDEVDEFFNMIFN
jgi:type II secretory ATPase GspE/PulE/Tfp pilus assembly ATPase PilB-like protein